MYNEVYAMCDGGCNEYAYIQIPQVVLGFGGFYLDSPWTMENLSRMEKKELAEYVNNREFYCEWCEKRFQVEIQVQTSNSDVKRFVI